MKKFLSVMLALAMILSLAACGGAETPTQGGQPTEATEEAGGADPTQGGQTSDGPQYGGHLNCRNATIATGLDPLKQTGTWRYLWTSCVFEGAVTRDAKNNICPAVCDFEISDDQLTFTLKVREGENFSNGDLVDIYDVEASYQRAFNLYNNIKKYVVPYVESMTVEGDSLVLKFTEYHEKIYHYLAAWQTWCPVMPKEICEKYATDYITDQIEDAIGTGPYVVTDYQDRVQVTISRREGYCEYEAGHDGYASQKKAYLDSMTFWTNTDDSSAALAALSGEYDMVEVMPSEYIEMATAQGIDREELASNVGCMMLFNTMGSNNICAKYPSLRKAIMSAIDYQEFVDVITDLSGFLGGCPVTGEEYQTDLFENADYYGAANYDLAEQYLEAARAEGYKDEPVQIVYENTRSDVPTLLASYMDKAGIDYEVSIMEKSAFDEFKSDVNNNWDFRFEWPTYSVTPTEMPVAIIETTYKSEAKDALIKQMEAMDPHSDEYKKLWGELAQMMVDDCASAYMGGILWFWYKPATFHSNDTGLDRYMFNAYWEDPANHTK